MLDIIKQLVADVLDISTDELNAVQDALLRERGEADGRYAVKAAMLHPEGSTTPLKDAHQRSQRRYADLRKKLEKELPKVLASIIALEVAKQRRDEAERHLDLQIREDVEYRATGVKVDTRDWMGRLVRHGVYPNYLRAHTDETVAIIADLITWKAKDATFQDPDNPWRAVLGIYAGRRIEKPDGKIKAQRSCSGQPRRARHRGESADYAFDQLVDPSWGVSSSNGALRTPDAAAGGSATHAIESGAPAEHCQPETATESVLSHPDAAVLVDEETQEGLTEMEPPTARADRILDMPQARAVAEAVLAAKPTWVNIYWPLGWHDHFDFGSPELVEALQREQAAGKGWTGSTAFLEAIGAGTGEAFIEAERHKRLTYLADRLWRREEVALKEAADAGVSI